MWARAHFSPAWESAEPTARSAGAASARPTISSGPPDATPGTRVPAGPAGRVAPATARGSGPWEGPSSAGTACSVPKAAASHRASLNSCSGRHEERSQRHRWAARSRPGALQPPHAPHGPVPQSSQPPASSLSVSKPRWASQGDPQVTESMLTGTCSQKGQALAGPTARAERTARHHWADEAARPLQPGVEARTGAAWEPRGPEGQGQGADMQGPVPTSPAACHTNCTHRGHHAPSPKHLLTQRRVCQKPAK